MIIASDFRVDGAKTPEIPQKEGVSASEIATRNRKSLATFHRTLKSQCKVSEIASDFWGPRWASQSQIAKVITAILVRRPLFALFPPFSRTAPGISRRRSKKPFFLRYPVLNAPSLEPPFAALQLSTEIPSKILTSGSKVQALEGNFRGESPPSSLQHVLTPPCPKI